MTGIGFVILSHSNPQQLLRLTARLSSMFPASGICCAHDFGQAPLDKARFPGRVTFVKDYISTRYAHISVVLAAMRGLRDLYQRHDPSWFVLMSGADYPVATSDTILAELTTSPYDAYLDFREIKFRRRREHRQAYLDSDITEGFARPDWIELAHDRYMGITLYYPSISNRLQPKLRRFFLRHPLLTRQFHPFDGKFRCFGGDHWFSGNRRVAKTLLDECHPGSGLIEHFSKCDSPDEAFYQTVICNQPALRVNSDNKRYADWSEGGAHPKSLEADDFSTMVSSGAHFARKFRQESQAIALLDRMIDQQS